MTGRCWFVLIGLLVAVPRAADAGSAPQGEAGLLDDFEDPSGWSAHPADGVDLTLHSDKGYRGKALRFDFRFQGGGYAVARKAFSLDLPANYAFTFRLRGAALPNHLEFKLIDESGENVWWHVQRDLRFPETWDVVTVKKRQIQFAWGPLGGGEIRHVAAIEVVVTAGQGGTGSIWIDDLMLRPLPPPGAPVPDPVVAASSSQRGEEAGRVLDGDTTTAWVPEPRDREPMLTLDLGGAREFSGLVLTWPPGRHAANYVVETSDDGREWRLLRAVFGGSGRRDFLYLPESESAHLRLRLQRTASAEGPALAEFEVKPLEWAASREAFFGILAKEAPRGLYPRAIAGEQSYWTVVGVDDDTREALLGEDGAIEVARGGPSVEPFLYARGRLWTWNDAQITQSLADDELPIPSVHWDLEDMALTVTAFGYGPAESSSVVARYRVENRGVEPLSVTLYLAVRPFQVNPPAQFLNLVGGCTRVGALAMEGSAVLVNGARRVFSLTPSAGFGAVAYDGGDIVADYLAAGRLPESKSATDAFEAASGALAFPLEIAPGQAEEIDLIVPLHGEASVVPGFPDAAMARAWVEGALDQARAGWRERLGRVIVEIPAAPDLVHSLKAQLGYILVNRAGPAIQPGARSYARSWIRDGALTSSALLRLGQPEPVREFLEWFAPYQYANGKIPCVVDARGADPVPEHDSSGEFIFLVAEYYRYTEDWETVSPMWPRVEKAAAYLDSLRQERRTPEWKTPENERFYGLLPPSISHEGYSAKPMHSYWDDFFALRGFKDTVYLAQVLHREKDAGRWGSVLDEFSTELAASLRAALAHHGIDYVPGCADLGDFDATSTTIALSPAEAEDLLPPGALAATFDKYDAFFREREGGAPWEAYTPYELRNIGALVRLGRGARAHEMLRFFLADQRPPIWRQWPEVVWHDARAPHFLGDLPHTWVGSDFIRSVLDMLAYPQYRDDSLVIGAGILASWLDSEPGVRVRTLPTPYGPLDLDARRRKGACEITIDILQYTKPGGPDGGFHVRAPLGSHPTKVKVNGKKVKWSGEGEVLVRSLPTTVRFEE